MSGQQGTKFITIGLDKKKVTTQETKDFFFLSFSPKRGCDTIRPGRFPHHGTRGPGSLLPQMEIQVRGNLQSATPHVKDPRLLKLHPLSCFVSPWIEKGPSSGSPLLFLPPNKVDHKTSMIPFLFCTICKQSIRNFNHERG